MQIIVDKELSNRAINIIFIVMIILCSLIISFKLRLNNYSSVIIEPFILNINQPLNLKNDIKLSEKINQIRMNSLQDTEITNVEKEDIIDDFSLKPSFKNIHVSMILISNKGKKCVINNVVLTENEYLDNDIKVLKITDYGVILQTTKGEIFVRSGENKVF